MKIKENQIKPSMQCSNLKADREAIDREGNSFLQQKLVNPTLRDSEANISGNSMCVCGFMRTIRGNDSSVWRKKMLKNEAGSNSSCKTNNLGPRFFCFFE